MTNQNYKYIPSLVDELPDIPPNTIISRTVFDDAQLKVVLFGFASGQELSEHTAAQPAMLYIVGGDARLTLGDEELEAQTGSWAHMPARLPHSIKALTALQLLLVLLKSPQPAS